MKKHFLLILLAGLVFAVPVTALECSALGVCCDAFGFCYIDGGPAGGDGCVTDIICGEKHYCPVDFVKQKSTGKCLYDCHWTRTCTESGCGFDRTFEDYGVDRFKIGPFPIDQCPAAVLSICGGAGSEPAPGEV